MSRTAPLTLALLCTSLGVVPTVAQSVTEKPSTTFTLSNGLTVVINEDSSVANVAVELWVRAGVRYEDAGHWGQAHFFEHIFGATRTPPAPGRVLDGNAQTRRDFCRYYLLVGSEALEYALALQADRLDYPLAAMTAERLKANRDIVINEYRGNESRPFGFGSATDVKMLVNGFGLQHPYGRPIQLNSDVSTLTDADMRRWIAARYTPGEAVLLIAGKVSVERARPLIERYFAPIPAVKGLPAGPQSRLVVEPIQPTPQRRERMTVAAPTGQVLAVWSTPRYGTADADYLTLFAEILAAPEVGRLYLQMVSLDTLASTTAADAQIEELAGLIRATVSLRPGASPQRAESVFLSVVDELSQTGPTDSELRTAKARLATREARQWERLGFQGSRIDLLGEGALYLGNADAYRERVERIANATREDVAHAARMWVLGHGYVLNAIAQASTTSPADIDRTRPVSLPPAVPPNLPPVMVKTLPDSLTLATMEVPESRLVNVTATLSPQTARATEQMRRIVARALTDRHPENRSRRAEAWRACIAVGGTVDVAVDGAATTITIETLVAGTSLALEAAATLFVSEPLDGGAVRRALSEDEDRRVAQDATTRIRAALADLLAGGEAREGRDNRETIADAAIRTMVSTTGATLIVAGGIQSSTVDATVKKLFGDRKTVRAATNNQGTRPARSMVGGPVAYVLDVPGRPQTLIAGGHSLDPITPATFIKARLATAIVGTRLNANLREQRHWSYGAQAMLAAASDGTPMLSVVTEVQADRTADAIAEIRREFGATGGDSETARLPFYRRDLTRQIVGSANITAGVVDALVELTRRGLPLTSYPELLRQAAATDETAIRESLSVLHADALVFIVAGDMASLRPQLVAVGITPMPLPE
jgi:zinc protease